MAEDVMVQDAPKTETQTENVSPDVVVSQRLASFIFDDTPAPAQQQQQAPPPEKEEEEILDPNVYLKNKWGWDSEEIAEQEIKTLREKAAASFEYKNEDSRKVAEYINEGQMDKLYDFLDTQKRVSKLATAEITDRNIAAELVKFGMKQDAEKDNVKLSNDDIEFLFNKKYSIPERPTQGDLEDEDDYKIKLNQWEANAKDIERAMIIEAKMAQPKMAQLKSELILQPIPRENNNQQAAPTQQELEAIAKERDSFLQSAQTTVKNFNGFTAQVKNKDVDYSVAYTPSNEEKSLIENKMKVFAESGFNTNALLADRWLNKDNTINVNQMAEDLSRIYMGKNADIKLANEAANKRLELHLMSKKHPHVNGQTSNGTFTPNGTSTDINDKLRENMMKVW